MREYKATGSLPKIHLWLAAGMLLAGTAAIADPAPLPSAPSSVLPGLTGTWVDTVESPHSIADALNALAGTGGFTVNRVFVERTSAVSFADFCCSALFADPFSPSGDDNFAVRYSGYWFNDTRQSLQFQMLHDDGIRVRLGGETIIEFDGDTGARLSSSAVFDVAEGWYAVEIIGWEQGGQFVNNFYKDVLPGPTRFFLDSFFSPTETVPTPAPHMLALFGIALAGWWGVARNAHRSRAGSAWDKRALRAQVSSRTA